MKKEEVVYRKPETEDAQAIVDFYNVVGAETVYLSFEGDEYPMNVKEQEQDIIDTKHQQNSIMLMATVDDKIVCIGTINSGSKVKSRHDGELGIVVSEEYQGQGIGTEMITRLLDWARGNGITTRVHLDTMEINENAVKLYEKFGFEKEGLLKNTTLIDGRYYNLYVMGMTL